MLYYGIFPLFIVLLVLYLSLWMMYRFNRRTVSPVIQLANRINKLDLYHPDFNSLGDLSWRVTPRMKFPNLPMPSCIWVNGLMILSNVNVILRVTPAMNCAAR